MTQGSFKTFLFWNYRLFQALCRWGEKALISNQESFSATLSRSYIVFTLILTLILKLKLKLFDPVYRQMILSYLGDYGNDDLFIFHFIFEFTKIFKIYTIRQTFKQLRTLMINGLYLNMWYGNIRSKIIWKDSFWNTLIVSFWSCAWNLECFYWIRRKMSW